MESLLPLLIILPFVGATVIGLAGFISKGFRQQEGLIGIIGTLCVAIPFLIYCVVFANFHDHPIDFRLFSWMKTGQLDLSFSYRLDQLSILMGMIVTGVGSLIHIYSIGYMHGDSGFYKFFLYLNLFIFAMSNLVLGDNMLVTFLGWEGVGACSYFLIGFWFTDMHKAAAAQKAFVANRVGDFAFLVAMFICFAQVGSLNYAKIMEHGLSHDTAFWVALLVFIAATGKSAQIPLYVWLPDAMAGPTPVSALIHAATMVTSGIYLITRMSVLFAEVQTVLVVISVVGGLTALMAALIAISQNDIKKVLAYSTVSQLGFMFMALGAGAFSTAIFHVMTHAFFKACLFLGSGSVIHAMEHAHGHHGHGHGHDDHGQENHHHGHHDADHAHHDHHHTANRDTEVVLEPLLPVTPDPHAFDPQDIRTMGGLRKYMPSTFWTFWISTLAIAGIPGLSGFFSKDEILGKVFAAGHYSGMYYFVYTIGILTAFLTAFYMSRLTYLTFSGQERYPADMAHKPHESSALITIPLWILAILAIVGGYVGLPEIIGHGEYNWISHHWLAAEAHGHPLVHNRHLHAEEITEIILIILSIAIAFIGRGFALSLYQKYDLAADEKVKAFFGSFYTVLQNKFYVDELYNATIVRPFVYISRFFVIEFDNNVVDGIVDGTGSTAKGLGSILRVLQSGLVQNYALLMMIGIVAILAYIMLGISA
jgi:NADH-quinone oxidoreductase subunit L